MQNFGGNARRRPADERGALEGGRANRLLEPPLDSWTRAASERLRGSGQKPREFERTSGGAASAAQPGKCGAMQRAGALFAGLGMWWWWWLSWDLVAVCEAAKGRVPRLRLSYKGKGRRLCSSF